MKTWIIEITSILNVGLQTVAALGSNLCMVICPPLALGFPLPLAKTAPLIFPAFSFLKKKMVIRYEIIIPQSSVEPNTCNSLQIKWDCNPSLCSNAMYQLILTTRKAVCLFKQNTRGHSCLYYSHYRFKKSKRGPILWLKTSSLSMLLMVFSL